MCDGYDERMSAFTKVAHPTPDECIMVVMDLLQSVKAKRWEHKGGVLNAVLRDYKSKALIQRRRKRRKAT